MDIWKGITELLAIQHTDIEDVKLFKKDLRAEITLRYQIKNTQCAECLNSLGKLHDWQFRLLSGPPLGIFKQVNLRFYFPRAYCFYCKKNKPAFIQWIHPHCPSMSCSFAEIAGRLMEETTCEAAARLLKANSRTLWELDQFRMQTMLERMKLPDSLDLSYLSADEVHFRTIRTKYPRGDFEKRWAPQFTTNLVSYEDSKVIFNAPGRSADSLTTALSILSTGQKLSVEKFAVDMHDPFISVIKKECPNAEVCIDRFHLAQQVNKTFDKVRKLEFVKAQKEENIFMEGMLSPSRRFILIEREKSLSKMEIKMLSKLRKLNIHIHSAMLLVEYFHTILDKKTVIPFRKALLNWYLLVRESKLQPFRKLATTIIKYRSNIEAYIKSRLTTAVSEGLNNKIKTLKKMAYGYTNPASFRNKILQRCGYLNHDSINTDDFFYKVTNPNL